MAGREIDYKALAKRLSDALLNMRVGDDYFADPDYCGSAIEKLRNDLHEARIEAQRLRQRGDEYLNLAKLGVEIAKGNPDA